MSVFFPSILIADDTDTVVAGIIITVLLAYNNQSVQLERGLDNTRFERKTLETGYFFYSGLTPTGAAGFETAFMARHLQIGDDIRRLKSDQQNLLNNTALVLVGLPLLAAVIQKVYRAVKGRSSGNSEFNLGYVPSLIGSSNETGRWVFRMRFQF